MAFTPDGPRGPRRELKPGVVAAAQRGGGVIVPIHAEADRAWRLHSWDRFMIPKPLARVRITYGRLRGRAGRGGVCGRDGAGGAGSRRGFQKGRMARRGDTHRVVRWLWTSRRPDARLARLALLPASGLWRGAMAVRERPTSGGGSGTRPPSPIRRRRESHRRRVGQDPDRHLDRPALRGARPRAGHPAAGVWRRRNPGSPARGPRGRGRRRPGSGGGAERAMARGAQVLVLDDAYQRLDVRRDLNVAVVSAETARAVRWPLPAGPWREGLARPGPGRRGHRHPEAGHRRRRTVAGAGDAGRVQGPVALAHLGLRYLEGMVSGAPAARERAGGQAGGGGFGHRGPGRVRGPDQGDRGGGPGRHLEGPP